MRQGHKTETGTSKIVRHRDGTFSVEVVGFYLQKAVREFGFETQGLSSEQAAVTVLLGIKDEARAIEIRDMRHAESERQLGVRRHADLEPPLGGGV